MESADFTNTEWNEAAIKAKSTEVLAEKADAKVISVSVSDSTTKITLRYGYSEATATIYTPSDAAAQWTAHIESTKLGSTTVPGSDMKYSETPDWLVAIPPSGLRRPKLMQPRRWKIPRLHC